MLKKHTEGLRQCVSGEAVGWGQELTQRVETVCVRRSCWLGPHKELRQCVSGEAVGWGHTKS